MIAFIDDHRDKHGVEPICEVLPIAPATYYEHLARRVDPARLSDRARRDEELRPHIQRVFDANWQVYGVRKIWRQLRREGFDVARCTVARLMKVMGIQGLRHWARTNGASMAQSEASRRRRRSRTRSCHARWTR
jgi:putative transposase